MTVTAFAPGRVNLIGEHTDYNTPRQVTRLVHSVASNQPSAATSGLS